MTVSGTTISGTTPTATSQRIPGPDLARGFMLLMIVLANTCYYLYGRPRSDSGAHPAAGSTLDEVVQGFLIITVDMRVYPMFAFLFGYGLVMITRRQARRGLTEQQITSMVQRRNLWLIAFGAVHALLLWGGDVLGAYGLAGLLLVWLFARRSDRTLLVWSGLGTAVLVLMAALPGYQIFAALFTDHPATANDIGFGSAEVAYATISEQSIGAAAVARALMWPVHQVLLQGLLGMAVPVAILLGFWAARNRVLERPQNHRRLLWASAIGGITIGWSSGLIHLLADVGVIAGLESTMSAFTGPQLATGLACGVGYVAAFALVGGRIADRPLGPVLRAITAVGKRSLTCYLAQSVLCAPVLAAWGLGLGAVLGSATMALYAVGVWVISLFLAMFLERRGRAGPAESLLRLLTYRPVRTSSTPP